MKRLNFIEIDEMIEYDPDRFCKVQYNKILKEVEMIKSRSAMMAAHVKRIQGMKIIALYGPTCVHSVRNAFII